MNWYYCLSAKCHKRTYKYQYSLFYKKIISGKSMNGYLG